MQLPDLPDGFEFVRGSHGVIACRSADRDSIAAAGFLPDGTRHGRHPEPFTPARESGREPLGLLQIAGSPCLARRFTHGGLARAFTGARFRDPRRPFVELLLSERLRGLGIGTPKVVAARAVKVKPFGFELTLVTTRMEGVQDLGWMLGEVRRGTLPKAQLQRALGSVGRLVASLHRCGFVHADLQPANLMIQRLDPGAPAAAIDLDRSRFEGDGPLQGDVANRNLGRLWRHVARREDEYGSVLSRTDRLRFLRGYGVTPRDYGAFTRDIAQAARSRGVLHRLGWWVDRRLGRGADQRALGPGTGGSKG